MVLLKAELGGIAVMIMLIREGSADDMMNAINVLMNLAANADNRIKIVTEGSVVVEEMLKKNLGWFILNVIVQEGSSISSWITLLEFGIADHETKAAKALLLLASDCQGWWHWPFECSDLLWYGRRQG
mmetsp:Transcript_26312/g.44399  ORF Transcript_26312/g.44399 Transcript_26312/m.44399 type:complete len:128 (+) Transcript_26312:20-403(+)